MFGSRASAVTHLTRTHTRLGIRKAPEYLDKDRPRKSRAGGAFHLASDEWRKENVAPVPNPILSSDKKKGLIHGRLND